MDRKEYIKTATKPTPEKYCAYCGKKMERKQYRSKQEDLGAFKRRKYCCWECMKLAFIKQGNGKQEWGPAHASARKIVYDIENRKKVCEVCGSSQNIDIHHKDSNHQNNNPDNLMLLCRSCHMKIHRKSTRTCPICGKPADGGRGYCNKHYIRLRKFGNPLMCYHKIIKE